MDSSPAKNKISVSASSLFSSSSPSFVCRQNPKSRNSETGNIMRRSFRGNPFPTDSSRRNSIGNHLEYGEKENQNEKDQIPNVVKTPKGTKNFMSPTISAVSKINPSPRKKILSDKNEVSRSFDKTNHQVQSSVLFSDVISIIREDKDHEPICIDENKQLDEESHDITVTDIDEIKSNNNSNFKISPLPPRVSYTFPVFESHEVDPPYDPKKNYLSPRPQFLHYKPNPRIEHHFDECKQLEELFISESSSCETDLSAEEEEVAYQEGVVTVEEETQDEVSEEHLEDEEEEKEVVCGIIKEEAHQISTQSRLKTSTLLGCILALCVAYLLLISSTSFSQSNIIIDSPLYEFIHISPEIIESVKESFEQLSVKLRIWGESSLVYLDKLISSLSEAKGYGSFQFYNLTDTLEDERLYLSNYKGYDTVFERPSSEISVAGLAVDSHDWSLEMDIEEENVGHQEHEEPENSCEIGLEDAYEEDGNEIEQESKEGEENYLEMVHQIHTQTEIKIDSDTEMKRGEEYHSEERNDGQETVEGQREYESTQNDKKNMEEAESYAHQLDDVESASISGHQQKETEVSDAETSLEEEGTAGKSCDVSAEATDVEENGNDLEEENGLGEVVNDESSEEILLSKDKKVVVLFSTVMVLLAAAATASFLLAKKKATPEMLPHKGVEPTTISNTEELNIDEHVSVENLMNEKTSSLKYQEEEEVDDGKKREVSSLPSEMSFSFHKNKPFQRCNNRDDQSGERGKKSNESGESMASSASEYSIGSVSYGSFTTYEKVQKRSGRKEEEMITPVRRSSRIRNSQHSGQ